MASTKRAGSRSTSRRTPSTPSTVVPSGRVLDTSTGRPFSSARHRPTASKFSMAKPIGSILTWHEAQAGLARCICIASFIDNGCPDRSVLRDGTSAGGGGGGDASRFSSTYLPRNTADVRVL